MYARLSGAESIAVRRAAGRLFQMCGGPATAKLLIHSVVVVLGMADDTDLSQFLLLYHRTYNILTAQTV